MLLYCRPSSLAQSRAPDQLREWQLPGQLAQTSLKSDIVSQMPTLSTGRQGALNGVFRQSSQRRHLKILIAVPYFPPHKGGTELYAQNLAEQLSVNFNWKVVVVTTAQADCADVERVSDDLTVYRIPYRFRLSNSPLSLWWLIRLKNILRTEDPALINVHAPVPGLGDMASLLAGHRPVVVNYHGNSMRKGRRLPDLAIWVYEHMLVKVMFRKASRIIASSDFIRDGVLSEYRDKTVTINPGVDTEIFRPADTPVNDPNVLFVGSLNKAESYKNLDGLLAACQMARASVPNLRLTIVGDGDGRRGYESIVLRRGLGDMTQFLGHLDHASLADVYRSAAVFAMPSTNESFGMVNAEAMASGLPVISTRVGGIPTLVDHEVTGLLVDPTDVAGLAKSLQRLLSERKLAIQLGRAGREKVATSLTWLSRGKLTDSVLHDVLAQRR